MWSEGVFERASARRDDLISNREKAFAGGKPMLLCRWAAALVIAPSVAAVPQSGSVDAVKPGGRGVLTKRIDWLVASSRRTYHDIRLPKRIEVGGTITFSFGSSTKIYAFPVARILLRGDRCEIFSRDEVHYHRDKISVTPCYGAG
jgi:hypothetical protein